MQLVNISEELVARLRRDFGKAIDSSGAGFGLSADYEIGDLDLSPITVEYANENVPPMADTIVQRSFLGRNCSKDEQTLDKRSIKFKVKHGNKISITKTITTTAGIKVALPIKFAKFSLDYHLNLSDTATEEIDMQEEHEVTEEYDLKVPPFTARVYVYDQRGYRGYTNFKGTFLVDGPLQARLSSGLMWPHAIGRLADKYMAKDRVYAVEGQIWNVELSEVTKTWVDKALDPNNPRDCPPIPNALPLPGGVTHLTTIPVQPIA
jgi:hypothetical protein